MSGRSLDDVTANTQNWHCVNLVPLTTLPSANLLVLNYAECDQTTDKTFQNIQFEY